MTTSLRRAVLLVGVALGLLVSAAGPAVAAPVAGPASSAATGVRAHRAAGDFTAAVDFPSLVVREVRGNKCEFRVNGTLTFTGTLEGAATGTTTAVIFAPCSEATS